MNRIIWRHIIILKWINRVSMHIHDDPDDQDFQTTAELGLLSRSISNEQFARFEGYAKEIFSAFGLDLNTPATKDTPRRYIRALYDSTEG